MFRLFCILFAVVIGFATHADDAHEIRASLQRVDCEGFLAGSTPVAPPGDEPPKPSFWTLFNWNANYFAERRLHQKWESDANEYQAYSLELANRRQASQVRFNSIFNEKLKPSQVDAAFATLSEELANKGQILINSAMTTTQLDGIDIYIREQSERILGLSSALRSAKKIAEDRLSAIIRQGKPTRFSSAIEDEATSTYLRVEHAASIDEVNALIEESRTVTDDFFSQHLESERARRIRESRFDVSAAGNSAAIVQVFTTLYEAPDVARFDTQRLALKMESDSKLKSFVYREMQILRRLRVLASSASEAVALQVRAGIDQRLKNDAITIERALADSSAIDTLRLVRRSLARLNHPELFSQMDMQRALRPMTSYEREQILSDALRSDELRLTILSSSLDLVASVRAPNVPAQPTLTMPSQPKVPRKVKSRLEYNRIKQQISDYKAKGEAFKKAWERYKAAVETYKNVTWPEYQEEVAQLKAAYVRRFKARQSYLAYLAFRHPEFMVSRAQADLMGAGFRQVTNRRISNTEDAEALRQLRARTNAAAASASDDTTLLDWYMFVYTQNPMWLIDRDLALIWYIFDWDHHSSEPNSAPAYLGVDPAQVTTPPADTSSRDLFPLNSAPAAPLPESSPGDDTPAMDPASSAVNQIETPVLAPELRDFDVQVPNLVDPQLPDMGGIVMPEMQMPEMPDFQMPALEIPEIKLDVPDIQIEMPSFSMDTSSSGPDFSSFDP